MPVDIALTAATVIGPELIGDGVFRFKDADFLDLVRVPIAAGATLAPDTLFDFGSVGHIEHYNILFALAASNFEGHNYGFHLRPAYLRRDEPGDGVEYTVMGLSTTDVRTRVFEGGMPANKVTVNILIQGGDNVSDIEVETGTVSNQSDYVIQQALIAPYVQIVIDNNSLGSSSYELSDMQIWGRYRKLT